MNLPVIEPFDPSRHIGRNLCWGIEGMAYAAEMGALYQAATRSGIVTVCEIGSHKGMSTALLAAAVKPKGGTVFAVSDWDSDIFGNPKPGGEERFGEFWGNMVSRGLDQTVMPMPGRSQEIGADWEVPLDLLYVDGDHRKGPVLEDLDLFVPWVRGKGVVALHDADCPGVSKALKVARAPGGRLHGFAQITKVAHLLILRVP